MADCKTIAPHSPAPAPITTERVWIDSLRYAPEWKPENRATVIVVPHPDDETLATGGLIATQRARQTPVTLLAVTDGEAAYPDFADLGRTRRAEQTRAAEALGIAKDSVIRLGLPDSMVTESEAALADRIEECLNPEILLVAPWPLDPHPDHEACGRAAETAARRSGASLIFYLFWTWHRFRPNCLNGLPLRRLKLSEDASKRRAEALACHQSQLYREEGQPILPACFLTPARRPFETFIVHD